MHRLVDDMLMAYADGALDDGQTAAVAELLARDPAAQRRLALFQVTRDLARLAYDLPPTAPSRATVETIAQAQVPAVGRSRFGRLPMVVGRWFTIERAAVIVIAALVGAALGSIVAGPAARLTPAKSEPARGAPTRLAEAPCLSRDPDDPKAIGRRCPGLRPSLELDTLKAN